MCKISQWDWGETEDCYLRNSLANVIDKHFTQHHVSQETFFRHHCVLETAGY